MERRAGTFTLNLRLDKLHREDNGAAAVAEQLAGLLRPATGFALKTSEGTGGNISLLIDTSGAWNPEEYRLSLSQRER